MNHKRMVFLLSVTALALLAANWQLYFRIHPNAATAASEQASSIPEAGRSNAATPTASNSPAEAALARSQKFAFDWSSVETTDYKQYAANLRALGLPEELVRSIVIADLDAHYAPEELKFQKSQVVHDGSWNERQGNWQTNEWDRILKLRDVEMAKQAAIKEVLGVYVPRPLLRTPRGENYEAYEYTIGLMPEDKRIAVQDLVEQQMISGSKNRDRPLSYFEGIEAYRVSAAARETALQQILSPAECDLFERNTTPCGTELARQTIGMEPTEDEFATMFQLAYKCWQDSGGVYGWWHALPTPPQQIQAAQTQLQTDLSAALGPDRYLDYQMAASSMGQQLQALAARYELPRDTVAQAFELQKQLDWIEKGPGSVREVGNGLIPPPTMPTDKSRDSLAQELRQVLGESVWQAWQDGRNRQVVFDPLKR